MRNNEEEFLEVVKREIKESGEIVRERMREFERIGKDKKEVFKELCFCLLTANFNAERAIKIQQEIGNGFIELREEDLRKKLKELGYRFPNVRAKFIVEAREKVDVVWETTKIEERMAREILVKEVKGLGFKESSHFLRNVGKKNVAIIDFHILDLLERFGIIEKPKSLNKNKYLEIEEKLEGMAKKLEISLGELDLYLWKIETGKVLK